MQVATIPAQRLGGLLLAALPDFFGWWFMPDLNRHALNWLLLGGDGLDRHGADRLATRGPTRELRAREAVYALPV
jgi:hypothetical protein